MAHSVAHRLPAQIYIAELFRCWRSSNNSSISDMEGLASCSSAVRWTAARSRSSLSIAWRSRISRSYDSLNGPLRAMLRARQTVWNASSVGSEIRETHEARGLSQWAPLLPFALGLLGIGDIAQNTVFAMAVIVQGAFTGAIWYAANTTTNRHVRNFSYATIAVTVLIFIVVLAASGQSFKSEPPPSAGPPTTSPSTPSSTTTTRTTTPEATATTSETTTTTPATAAPPLPPRPMEKGDVSLGGTSEFFAGDLLIGLRSVYLDSGYANLTLSTRRTTCSQSPTIGGFVDMPGKHDGRRSWFRLFLLNLTASSITLRVEELPEPDWPASPSLACEYW